MRLILAVPWYFSCRSVASCCLVSVNMKSIVIWPGRCQVFFGFDKPTFGKIEVFIIYVELNSNSTLVCWAQIGAILCTLLRALLYMRHPP